MQESIQSLTVSQLASILQITECTVTALARSGMIPYMQDKFSTGPVLRFNPCIITGWLKQGPMLMIDENARIEKLKAFYQSEFPEAINTLKEYDKHFAVKSPSKGYTLSRVKNKRYGFLYYVRYIHNGKIVPSRWCTHTNDLSSAEQFSRDNRERIIDEYYHKREHGLYAVLRDYYKAHSRYRELEENRGTVLGRRTRAIYDNFTNKVLVPFFRKLRIQGFEEITPPVILELQNYLLKKGNKPQTINRYLGSLKAVLNYLVMHGELQENVFSKATMLRANKKHYRIRGCHEISALKGVFQKPWADDFSYLLCLMIYTTGMRNSEIEKIRVKDLIKIKGLAFIDIAESKTENGIRIVPLHHFVYKKLAAYIQENGRQPDDYLFSVRGRRIQTPVYRKANNDLGEMLKLTEKDLEGISFYSGRHFWKTLMSSEDLGNIEEYFMGHKVSRDVAKLYNHLDKQGQEKIVEKAKEVFKILDRRLFS